MSSTGIYNKYMFTTVPEWSYVHLFIFSTHEPLLNISYSIDIPILLVKEEE